MKSSNAQFREEPCENCGTDGVVSVSVPCPCCKGDKSGHLYPQEAYAHIDLLVRGVMLAICRLEGGTEKEKKFNEGIVRELKRRLRVAKVRMP